MTKKRFTVVGPHRVDGVAPGESVELDSDAPVTQRLLARGQVAASTPVKIEDDDEHTNVPLDK